jgi:hypothetical protein
VNRPVQELADFCRASRNSCLRAVTAVAGGRERAEGTAACRPVGLGGVDSAEPRGVVVAAPEAVAYGVADEVIGGPAGAPESGTPA